jgi:hypothetical protein
VKGHDEEGKDEWRGREEVRNVMDDDMKSV